MNKISCFALLLLGCCLVAGQTSAPDECTAAGFRCSNNCSQVQFCAEIRSSLRGFDMTVVAECDAAKGYFCDEQGFQCTNTSSCPGTNFECGNTGSYPDPVSCSKHYTCIVTGDKQQAHQTCQAGYAYDPLSGSCLFNLKHDVCTKGPVPKCTPGSMGPVPLNPSIWYICILDPTFNKYYHKFFRCPHGRFQTEVRSCQDVGEGNGSVTNGPDDPTEQPSFVCPGAGYYEVPGDCRSYYHCDSKLQYTKGSCIPDYHFYQPVQHCVPGQCTDTKVIY